MQTTDAVDEKIANFFYANNVSFLSEDFQNLDLAGEEAFLRNFDLGEEARWSKRFAEGFAGCAHAAAELEPFNCFIEKFEDRSKTTLGLWRTRAIEFKIKAKWLGMYLYDEDVDEDGEEYGDHRKIVGVEWAPHKGYKLETVLIDKDGKEEEKASQGYLVNSSLPTLVKAGKNPTRRMVFA